MSQELSSSPAHTNLSYGSLELSPTSSPISQMQLEIKLKEALKDIILLQKRLNEATEQSTNESESVQRNKELLIEIK